MENIRIYNKVGLKNMTPEELSIYKREAQKRWRENNKDKIRLKFHTYYLKNREEHIRKQKIINNKNKVPILD